MGFFNKYPYTDFHELNLDWIIDRIKKVERELTDFEALHKIVWRGAWDIAEYYQPWSIVQDKNGNGYISVQPVFPGVAITNDEYWEKVANYDTIYQGFSDRISALEKSPIYYKQDELLEFTSGKSEEKKILFKSDNHTFNAETETMEITQEVITANG